MNKDRRKRINQAVEMLDQARNILEECMDEEEEYRDNMPENLQGSEKYEVADSNVDCLESAVTGLEDVIDNAMNAAE